MTLDIDHFVWGTPDLDRGNAMIADLLGVAPEIGGSHPGFGTRNALVSLGENIYLEIIAPDTGELPPGSLGEKLSKLSKPGLMTWVCRSDALSDLAQSADLAQAGLSPIGPLPATRTTPDGMTLSWELMFLGDHNHGGLIPFLIDWADTPHPSVSAPLAGEFAGFRLSTPEPDSLGKAFASLGIDTPVDRSDTAGIELEIATATGVKSLSSTPETIHTSFA